MRGLGQLALLRLRALAPGLVAVSVLAGLLAGLSGLGTRTLDPGAEMRLALSQVLGVAEVVAIATAVVAGAFAAVRPGRRGPLEIVLARPVWRPTLLVGALAGATGAASLSALLVLAAGVGVLGLARGAGAIAAAAPRPALAPAIDRPSADGALEPADGPLVLAEGDEVLFTFADVPVGSRALRLKPALGLAGGVPGAVAARARVLVHAAGDAPRRRLAAGLEPVPPLASRTLELVVPYRRSAEAALALLLPAAASGGALPARVDVSVLLQVQTPDALLGLGEVRAGVPARGAPAALVLLDRPQGIAGPLARALVGIAALGAFAAGAALFGAALASEVPAACFALVASAAARLPHLLRGAGTGGGGGGAGVGVDEHGHAHGAAAQGGGLGAAHDLGTGAAEHGAWWSRGLDHVLAALAEVLPDLRGLELGGAIAAGEIGPARAELFAALGVAIPVAALLALAAVAIAREEVGQA